MSAIVGMLQNSGNTKITDLNGTILIHKDVLSFQISVQNFSIVDMLYSQGHLYKPIKNLVFAVAHFSNFLLVCDFRVEISSVCIVHDNAETPLVHK